MAKQILSPRLALLIDAENISHKDLSRILRRVTPLGELTVKAVYGNWDLPALQPWHEAATQNDFKIRHQSNPSKTKNTSDMKLIMDAMEIIHHVPVDAFCLVTNDADYIPLCDKLHEAKKYVVGIGYQHAAELLMRACDQFIFIKRKTLPVAPVAPVVENPIPIKVETPPPVLENPSPVPEQPAIIKTTPMPNLKKLLKKAFAQASSRENEWIALSPLGTAIRQIDTGFDSNNYDHPTLSRLLDSVPNIVELKGSGNDLCARLKPTPTPKKATLQKNLEKLLSQAFDTVEPEKDEWVKLSSLGNALRKVQTGFTSKKYGHATLSKLLQTMPHFVELHNNGNGKSARLKK